MSYIANFVKNGNIKIGDMWTFNKLAGGGEIAGCKGTCGDHCTGCYNPNNPKKSPCYVFKSYVTYGWDKSSVVKSHINNTNAIRNHINIAFEDLEKQLQRAKKKPQAIRIHSSGELESQIELLKWKHLASKYPNIKFYLYTKAYDVLEYAIQNIILWPSNFFINISIWHDNGLEEYLKYKNIPNIRAFVYDDGYKYENLKIDKYCPAYQQDEKGKIKLNHKLTCDKCKMCFSTKNKVIACLDH